MRHRLSLRERIGDLLSGPAGYVFVLVLLLLYLFHALAPFQWDPPRQVINGAIRTQQEIRFDTPGILSSPGPAAWVGDAIRRHELKVSLRVLTYSIDQFGPARIFTVSLDPNLRNLTIAQEGSGLVLRLRTTSTTLDGKPQYVIPGIFTDSQWHDIELTIRDQQLSLVHDGEFALLDRLPESPLTNWDRSYQMALGNELTGDRSWLGQVARAEVTIEGKTIDYLNLENLELPASYGPMPTWKTMVAGPLSGMGWKWAADIILNFLCFIPVGLGLGCTKRGRESFWLAVGLVATVSFLVELAQYGFAQRFPSAVDWIMNTAGAAVGIRQARFFLNERPP